MMLSTLHNRAYQNFYARLANFRNFVVNSQNKLDLADIKQKFQELEEWFQQNISNLDDKGIEKAYIPRWQSIQREINREFKLLTTYILFLASARQESTRIKRFQSIINRLDKLNNYCQGLLKEASRIE